MCEKCIDVSVIHTMAEYPEKTTRALPLFLTFTGCDIVSGLFAKGKKMTWFTWGAIQDLTADAINLSHSPKKLCKAHTDSL